MQTRLAFTGSQFQHQTDPYKIELTPLLSVGSIKTNNAEESNVSATDTVFNFSLAGEYGINQMLSAGLKLGYALDSYSMSGVTGTAKASGVTDPAVFSTAEITSVRD